MKVITDACEFVMTQGIYVKPGAWFEFSGDIIVSCDALGAVLIHQNLIPKSFNPKNIASCANPGFVEAICKTLDVDTFWLRRFWI